MRSAAALGVAMILLLGAPAAAEVGVSAEALFRRGGELFLAGSHQEALEAYQRSYQLSPVNVVLYNIAMCQRELGSSADAIATFERYLSGGGDQIPEERRTAVRAAIEELRAQVGAQEPPPEQPGDADRAETLPAPETSPGPRTDQEPSPEPVERDAGRGRSLRLAAYVTGAIALATLGTTTGLFAWNSGRSDDWERDAALLSEAWLVTPEGAELEELDRRYQEDQALGEELRAWGAAEWALLGVGVAALGVAVALLVVGLRRDRPERASSATSPSGFVLSAAPRMSEVRP